MRANNLLYELGYRFPCHARSIGDDLDVELRAATPTLAEARVDEFTARLEWRSNGLVARCGCDPFLRGDLCAHLWAALKTALERGALDAMNRAPFVRIVHEFDLDIDPGSWKSLVRNVLRRERPTDEPDARLIYILRDDEGRVVLQIAQQRKKMNGEWSVPTPKKIREFDIPEGPDRRILEALSGIRPQSYDAGAFELSQGHIETLIPALCKTGRFFSGTLYDLAGPLTWDDGAPWSLELGLLRAPGGWTLTGRFKRGEKSVDLLGAHFSAGIFISGNVALRASYPGGYEWLLAVNAPKPVFVPDADVESFRRRLLLLPNPPDLVWPPELAIPEIRVAPLPHLRINADVSADLQFLYDGVSIGVREPSRHVFTKDGRVVVRNPDAEAGSIETLLRAGFRERYHGQGRWHLPPRKLPRAVRALVAAGWRVEADKGVFRKPGALRISVRSGIDWFDVEGGVEFEGKVVPFPRLLEALRRGQEFVTLDDGTQGIVPEEWLKRNGFLLKAGETKDGVIRFRPSQAMMLDALLAAEPQASCDREFEEIRARLKGFEGVRPVESPEGFQGELRPYQKIGLGWMRFLQEFSLGGCLADDMGLGKTVQVIAMLLSRPGPALVVAPRSLIFNWKAELARFAPGLKTAERAGIADVVLMTYGELRRDAASLKNREFEYVILDESQAIKNSGSATAKAAKLLKGRHRLALSGTPIENHLGELWSLFEFLNPGMLGRFEDADMSVLSRVIRPFILRRTKREVASDLPDRTEQTLLCDMEPRQREYYNELREHYRTALLGRGGTKFQVLEGLLRLRQAACHPGLVDRGLRNESSVKLDVLLEQLKEVRAEGHKSLVFSQFTSFLSIVKDRLVEERVPFEYLDGRTRDRGEIVRRFQESKAPGVFLISLKAGGLGLNLTSAEYVFLLDPWWNPAVEAQAIDRAHRIGQTRRVFAYRIVARGTVEEKVLQLQATKRKLADAILGEEGSLLGDLTREDLELLLS